MTTKNNFSLIDFLSNCQILSGFSFHAYFKLVSNKSKSLFSVGSQRYFFLIGHNQ